MQFHLDYFYGMETRPFRFYRIPKSLFDTDSGLSLEAATLYGLMLDRVGLSARNGWTNGLGRVYIYFVQTEVQKRLRCGHNRVTVFMRELKRFGLIEHKRQGLGKPAMIFVKNISGCKNDDLENTANGAVEPAQNKDETAAIQPEKAALFSASIEAVQRARRGQSGLPEPGGE